MICVWAVVMYMYFTSVALSPAPPNDHQMVPAVAAVTRSDDNNSSIQAQAPAKNQKPSSSSSSSSSWCDTVAKARSDLDPALHIQVPCEDMSPAKSAIVVYITAGVEEGKGTKTVF